MNLYGAIILLVNNSFDKKNLKKINTNSWKIMKPKY